MTDKEIVELFLTRSPASIQEAQNKYKRYMNYISRNILGNDQDAEECVNEALNAAWKRIPPYEPENLQAFLGKLVREISISRWRENHAAKRYAGEYAASLDEIAEIAADEDFAAELEKQELSAALSAYLRRLPAMDRNLLIRRYWYGDSIRRISELYGSGEGKIKMRLQRAREKLRGYLKEEGWIT